MTRFMTRLLAIGLAVGLFAVRSEGQDKGQTTIAQGNWLIVSIQDDGMAQPVPKDGMVKITQDKLAMLSEGKPLFEFACKIDTTKSPMHIDLTQGNSKVLGICELKDDKLMICLGHPDKARAKSFALKGVPENDVLMVLQRTK